MGRAEKRKQNSSTPSNEDARDNLPLANLSKQATYQRKKKKQDASSFQAEGGVEQEQLQEQVPPQIQESDESEGEEVWRKYFKRSRAFQLYKSTFNHRGINAERVICLENVAKRNPDIYMRFQKHTKWEETLSKPLCEANRQMVAEFYANLATNKKGDSRVYCRGKYVNVNAASLNEFLELDNFEPTRYMRKCAMTEKRKREWLVPIIGNTKNPAWKKKGVQIHRNDLNFEAKGWHYIVISRVRPSSQDGKLTVPQALMIGCLMKGIKVNLGAEMAKEMVEVALSTSKNLAYLQTLTAFLLHHGVETRTTDTYWAPRKPFNWYAFKDDAPPSTSSTPVPSILTLPSTSEFDPHIAGDATTDSEAEELPRVDLDVKLEELKTLLSNLPQVQTPPPPPPPAVTREQFADMVQAMKDHTLAIDRNTTALAEHTAALRDHTKELESTKMTVARTWEVATGMIQYMIRLDEKVSKGFNVPSGLDHSATATAPDETGTHAPSTVQRHAYPVQPSKASRRVTSGKLCTRASLLIVEDHQDEVDDESRKDLEATKAMHFSSVDDDDTDDDILLDDSAPLQVATHLSTAKAQGSVARKGKDLA